MSKVVYFLDIDDCLIHTSKLRPVHLAEVEKSLNKLKIKKGREITKEFAASFGRLFILHQDKKLSPSDQKLHIDWLEKVRNVEKPIVERYREIKRWSREVAIYLAAQKYGFKLSNTNLIYITNNLWSKISQTATFYPDSLPLLRHLLSDKIPFYLITSSDCRLKLDDKTGLFHYDPAYSKKLKLARIAKFIQMGIPKENIFVADPYDKPDPWVFRRALSKAKKDMKGEKFVSVMIGDSPRSDLYPAKEAGMEILVWVNRSDSKRTTENDLTIINKLRFPISDLR